MSKQTSMDKIVKILKDGALKFHDDFDANLKYYFYDEKRDNEIIVHFNMKYGRELEYLIILKKLKTMSNHIPIVRGYNPLDLNSNPFRKLNFTDENTILGNIYDLIKKIDFKDIACYEKFGIILLNPLELTGIYNINIKYITD